MMKACILIALIALAVQTAPAGNREILYLWPGDVPGETERQDAAGGPDGPDTESAYVSSVTRPVLVVYEAEPEKRNGAAVIVCPGGGYNRLAIEKEGYEIAEWLNGLGYTAFVLQYRVPRKEAAALMDALRAVRTVRGMHETWGLETDRIGMLGFSAGGSLTARTSTRYAETLYDPVDEFDALPARPDFAVLIYPAYLDRGTGHTLTPELKVNSKTPPMFIFVSADDKYANSSLVMGSALRAEKVPFELHILPYGGHGYGMRKGKRAAETWPNLCAEWMRLILAD